MLLILVGNVSNSNLFAQSFNIRYKLDSSKYQRFNLRFLFTEPNNFWGFEGCVTLFSGTGHWNDVYCSRPQNGYICKKTVGGDWTTPRPTDMPEGHCPADHYEYRGYCYKFVGFNGDVADHKNWTDAREQCQSLGATSELVSIHSQKEQAYLISVLAAHDSTDIVYEFWIGFHDYVHWDYDEVI